MFYRYFPFQIFVIIVLFNFAKPCVCYSQDSCKSYFVNIKACAQLPTSGTTFKTYWSPVIDLSLSGLKRFHKKLYYGLDLDYSIFYIDDWIELKSKLHILSPGIAIGYDLNLFKRLKLFPDFSLGYSWMTFTNPITPSKYIQSYNESGFSVKPGFSIGYLFKNKISLGLNGSYKIIFKRFGSESINLYENRKETAYTSYLNMGILVGLNF